MSEARGQGKAEFREHYRIARRVGAIERAAWHSDDRVYLGHMVPPLARYSSLRYGDVLGLTLLPVGQRLRLDESRPRLPA